MSAVDIKTRDDDVQSELVADNNSDTHDIDSATDGDGDAASRRRSPRRVSFSLRSIGLTLIVSVLAVTAGTFGWLYFGARGQLAAEGRAAADRARAESAAMEYAVNAAQMDYQDFNAWKIKLVNGTSPALKEKLTKAADSMQQILSPLQWKSTARPLAAKVRSEAGGVYVVDSFVSVLTKTMQAPDGLQSTATYSVTLDSKNNWQITDVGGIDAALGK